MRKKMVTVPTGEVGTTLAAKEEPIQFTWVKRVGSFVQKDDVLGTCKTSAETFQITAATAGLLRELPESRTGNWKDMIENCKHPMAMGRLCALCGVALVKNEYVPVKTRSDKFTYQREHAKAAETAYKEQLFRDHKLLLVLDIDHTLVHSCDLHDPQATRDPGTHRTKDIDGHSYVVQFRPFLKEFLSYGCW
jgi:hypothetical protein